MTQLANHSLDLEISGPEGQRLLQRLVSPVTIGRAEGNTVVLTHDDVSRKHAVVEFLADGLAVHDFSTNGTFIEGRRIEGSAQVSMGRPIRMGPYVLRFLRIGTGPQQVVSGEASVRTAPVREESPPLSAVVVDDSLLVEHSPTRPPVAPAPSELPLPPASPVSPALPASLAPPTPSALPGEADEVPTGALGKRTDEPVSGLGMLANRPHPETDEEPGLGPLEEWLKDDSVSEILVVDRASIYLEREGRLVLTEACFPSDEALRRGIARLLASSGRRLDEAASLVEARLQDGTQVSIALPPVALRGPSLAVRKPARHPFRIEELVARGTLDERMARFLGRAVAARRNMLVSGGGRAGKTALLQALAAAIPAEERIFTLEEAPELRLWQPHVVALAARPGERQGRDECTMRDLLRSALRMRPDRLVVGECRGGEVIEFLAALDAGHDGALTTLQAGSTAGAVTRLEMLALGAGCTLPLAALRAEIARVLHLVVHVVRLGDGTRRVGEIAEVVGVGGDGAVRLEPIFSGRGNEFRATGYRPSFLGEFVALGLAKGDNDDLL